MGEEKRKYPRKKVDYVKFCEAYDAFCRGEMTKEEAGAHCGISRETFRKYKNMVWRGEPLPGDVFGYDESGT